MPFKIFMLILLSICFGVIANVLNGCGIQAFKNIEAYYVLFMTLTACYLSYNWGYYNSEDNFQKQFGIIEELPTTEEKE